MMEYVHSQIVPRIDHLEAQFRKLETRAHGRPIIDIEIETKSAEELAEGLDILYSKFGLKCEMKIKCKVKTE